MRTDKLSVPFSAVHPKQCHVVSEMCVGTNNDVLCIQSMGDDPCEMAAMLSDEKHRADFWSSRVYAKP
jgi:hypothetical protein